jgi:hypothetical protein
VGLPERGGGPCPLSFRVDQFELPFGELGYGTVLLVGDSVACVEEKAKRRSGGTQGMDRTVEGWGRAREPRDKDDCWGGRGDVVTRAMSLENQTSTLLLYASAF